MHDDLFWFHVFDDEGVSYALVRATGEEKAMEIFYKGYRKSFPDGCLRIRRLALSGKRLVVL